MSRILDVQVHERASVESRPMPPMQLRGASSAIACVSYSCGCAIQQRARLRA